MGKVEKTLTEWGFEAKMALGKNFSTHFYIVDSVMGSGKTTAAINMINNAGDDKRFLFITPYLKQVERIILSCADKQFEQQLGKAAQQDGTSIVTIKSYAPNHLVYEANSDKGGVLVFSEIYYPEWTATVDGQKVDIGRVNYVLRAINVKPGKHEVVLDFHPTSIRTTEGVAYASYGLLAVLIAVGILVESRKRKQAATDKQK